MFENPPSPDKGLYEHLLDTLREHGMNEKSIEQYKRWESERRTIIEGADPTTGAKIRLELARAQLFFDANMQEEADEAYNDAVTMAEHEGLEHLLEQ